MHGNMDPTPTPHNHHSRENGGDSLDDTMLEPKPLSELPVPSSVIMPPPDIRTIVEKTAHFVSKNGVQFEGKIRDKEAHNPRFFFLTVADPYHPYYQWALEKFRLGFAVLGTGTSAATAAADEAAAVAEAEARRMAEEARRKMNERPPVPAGFKFMLDLPPMHAQDLDVVKLTAQYVARNGRPFLHQLQQREARNPQFDFMLPSHPLFPVFTALVDQYTTILLAAPSLLQSLTALRDGNPAAVVARAQQRAKYAQWEAKQRKKNHDEQERERIAHASIDWVDFAVVQAIDFTEYDEQEPLPEPTTVLALDHEVVLEKRRRIGLSSGVAPSSTVTSAAAPVSASPFGMNGTSLASNAAPAAVVPAQTVSDNNNDSDDQEMDMDDSDQDMDVDEAPAAEAPARPAAPKSTSVLPSVVGPMKIKSSVVARKSTVAESTSICKRCGLAIPDSQMEEHMRIELLDPKWREQRESAAAARRETNLASGDQVEKTLKHLAEYRKDLFGGDEIDLQRKLDEERARAAKQASAKVIWDGHTGSIANATMKAKEIVPLDEQIAAIHRAKGLVEMHGQGEMFPMYPASMALSLQPAPAPPTMSSSSSSGDFIGLPGSAPQGGGVRMPPPLSAAMRGRAPPPPPPRPPRGGSKPTHPRPSDGGDAQVPAKRARVGDTAAEKAAEEEAE
ncbi:Pre-mRNA splicing factor PRP21 like protein-domain-containing protein [Blastocladiella britannica]|nr:Pre-mRNA splicing factor PRP21 like protein-domain-containing protein [Blastocladiella britannica]